MMMVNSRIAMTTQVSIIANAAQNALTIPSTALGKKNNEGKYLVKVLGVKTTKPKNVGWKWFEQQTSMPKSNRV